MQKTDDSGIAAVNATRFLRTPRQTLKHRQSLRPPVPVVDLPTPPFPDATATIEVTPGMLRSAWGREWPGRKPPCDALAVAEIDARAATAALPGTHVPLPGKTEWRTSLSALHNGNRAKTEHSPGKKRGEGLGRIMNN